MRGILPPLLAFAMFAPGRVQESPRLVLELRVFNGQVEVSPYTRLTVHKAGDRGQPLAHSAGGATGVALQVPEGIYDVQAIEERDGQVVNIQWANRLVVMPYPDEGGRHLEVLNFKTGFGALQVRSQSGLPEVILHTGTGRDQKVATPHKGEGYLLFVVPAGAYDLSVRSGSRTVRHAGIEVPRDRTRLWIVPHDE